MKIRNTLFFSLSANAIFAVASLTGILLWLATEPVPPPAPDATEIDSRSPSVGQHPSEGAPWLEIAPPTSQPVTEALPDPVDFQDLLVELEKADLRIVPSKMLDRLNFRALDADARVTRELQELFSLGVVEIESLNKIFGDTAERLKELEFQNMEIKVLSNEKTVVRIEPLGSAGHELRQELRKAINGQLGELDGGLVFDLLDGRAGTPNRGFWSDFSEHGAEITLETNPDDPERILIEWKPANTEIPKMNWRLNREFLPHHFTRQRYLMDLLPESLRVPSERGD